MPPVLYRSMTDRPTAITNRPTRSNRLSTSSPHLVESDRIKPQAEVQKSDGSPVQNPKPHHQHGVEGFVLKETEMPGSVQGKEGNHQVPAGQCGAWGEGMEGMGGMGSSPQNQVSLFLTVDGKNGVVEFCHILTLIVMIQCRNALEC